MPVAVRMDVPVVPETKKLDGTLHPLGYRILVRILHPDEKEHDRLIHLPPEVREREWGAQPWAEVIELGPDAYKDPNRYPNGPWCKAGDYVLMRPYSGTRFKVDDFLYALINDDTVEGLTTEPEKIERI